MEYYEYGSSTNLKEPSVPSPEYLHNWLDIAMGKVFPELSDGPVFQEIFHPVRHYGRIQELYRLIFSSVIKPFPTLLRAVPQVEISWGETGQEIQERYSQKKGENPRAGEVINRAMDQLNLPAADLLLDFTVRGTDIEAGPVRFIVLLCKKAHPFDTSLRAVRYLRPMKDTPEFLSCPVCLVSINLEKCEKHWKEKNYPRGKDKLYAWMTFIGNVNGPQARRIVREEAEMAQICQELRRYGKIQGQKIARSLGVPELSQARGIKEDS